MLALFAQTWHIYRRNFRIWLAQPFAVLPGLFISAFLFIVFGFSFGEVVAIPGFPAESYLAFITGMILVQAMVFSGGDSGFAMLTDIVSGYFDKLLLAPINRFSILLGSVLIAATRSLMQTVVIIVLALALGVEFQSGIGGILVIALLTVGFGVAWSCLGLIIAIRTKSAQATQSSFVLFFPFVFMTTSFMPKDLLPGWFQLFVTINPVTYVLEGVRALVVVGWDWGPIVTGLWVTGLSLALLLGFTTWLYRRETA
jgi:ABC-2 type transport system permease protein